MSDAETGALRRVREIAKKYGLEDLAKSHADYFGSDVNDVFRLAPYVCAAAQDKYRLKDASLAAKICEEIWADSWLVRESDWRYRRDLAIESLKDYGFDPHRFIDAKNTYAEKIDDVEIVLRCPNCGETFARRYKSVSRGFRQHCPRCGTN